MAGYSINRIPISQRKFLSEVPNLWTLNGAGSLDYSPSTEKYSAEGSIQSMMSVGESISFNIDITGNNGLSSSVSTTALDIDDTISGFLWIKTNKAVIVDFQVNILYPFAIPAVSVASYGSRSISVTSGEWTLLRLYEPPLVPDDSFSYPIGLKVTIESIENDSTVLVNLSHPVIYGTLDFINNPGIVQIMTQLPEFIRDEDANGEPFSYQLTRFIEASTIHMGEITGLVNDFVYSDISEGKDESSLETLSTLVDPSVAPREYLFWLSQFSGTKLINPKTGVTPWANLPATWQGIDLIDSIESENDSSPWSSIQDYNTEPAGLDQFLRWQTQTGYYGINAGSKEAIISAVKRVLTGTKQVTYEVIEPFDWTIKITTLKSETPDSGLLDIGDTVLQILQLVEPTRPLGYSVIHELA